MTVWPGDPAVRVTTTAQVAADGVMVSRLEMGTHCGTHIDAPCHFINGAGPVDEIAPWKLVGPCRVLDVTKAHGHISRADLEPFDAAEGERLLLKTRNRDSLRRGFFDKDYAGLTLDAAQYLAERDIALIGIDYLSIEPFGAAGHPVHRALLERGIVILEGLDLHDVVAGPYELAALPLRLSGLDGSPTRALLRPLARP